MRFMDEARIHLSAGHGGSGAVSFLREKFRPRGPADGGNGGRGGDIYLEVSSKMTTLLDYKYRQHFKARPGTSGSTCDCTGADGEDLVLPVPPGTLVYDDETGDLLQDLTEPGRRLLVARGGRGGKGNAHFSSSTNQSPRFSQPGEPGEKLLIRLELKLLADVGLVGMPNAGKSSFLKAVSAARPKVADYPFTTLNPILGVVYNQGGGSFVMADIPGLVENASQGVGLGIEFLRHIERCSVLLHLIDISPFAGEQPDRAWEIIQKELAENRTDLSQKPRWIVLTKTDISDPHDVQRWVDFFSGKGDRVFAVSSASRSGVADVVEQATAWVAQQKATKQEESWQNALGY